MAHFIGRRSGPFSSQQDRPSGPDHLHRFLDPLPRGKDKVQGRSGGPSELDLFVGHPAIQTPAMSSNSSRRGAADP